MNEYFPYWFVCARLPKGPSTWINRSGSLLVGTFFRLTGGSWRFNVTPGGRVIGAPPTRKAHG